MKEEEVTPGTIYPLVEKLLYFLPECVQKKLCCVTQPVSHLHTLNSLPSHFYCFKSSFAVNLKISQKQFKAIDWRHSMLMLLLFMQTEKHQII